MRGPDTQPSPLWPCRSFSTPVATSTTSRSHLSLLSASHRPTRTTATGFKWSTTSRPSGAVCIGRPSRLFLSHASFFPHCLTFYITLSYMPEDAADTIARESGYYTACRRLLEDGSLDRPRPVLPSSPFTSLRIDGVLAGTIGIYPDDEDKQCFDVGYVLLPEFRGRGYMREAVRTLAETMEGWLKSPVAKWGAYSDYLPLIITSHHCTSKSEV